MLDLGISRRTVLSLLVCLVVVGVSSTRASASTLLLGSEGTWNLKESPEPAGGTSAWTFKAIKGGHIEKMGILTVGGSATSLELGVYENGPTGAPICRYGRSGSMTSGGWTNTETYLSGSCNIVKGTTYQLALLPGGGTLIFHYDTSGSHEGVTAFGASGTHAKLEAFSWSAAGEIGPIAIRALGETTEEKEAKEKSEKEGKEKEEKEKSEKEAKEKSEKEAKEKSEKEAKEKSEKEAKEKEEKEKGASGTVTVAALGSEVKAEVNEVSERVEIFAWCIIGTLIAGTLFLAVRSWLGR